jgi:hypothetical protein
VILPTNRTLCGCCAHADETAHAATRAIPAKILILFISFLPIRYFQ